MYYIILFIVIFILVVSFFVKINKFNKLLIDKDIEIEILSSEINRLAVKDPLTDTFNRHYFDENYIKEFHRARRGKQPLALMFFEIDDFEDIKNFKGSEAADNSLKEISSILNEVIQRDTDFVARYNSHIFAAVLYNAYSDGVDHVTQRIISKLKDITLSIGIHVGIPDNHTNTEMMINESLKALGKAKNQTLNSVEFSLNSI